VNYFSKYPLAFAPILHKNADLLAL